MASKRRKSSPYTEAYRKERKRIQRQINRMVKRGYEFEKNPLPAIPKTITAGSVRRLKAITTQKLYELAEFVDREYGDILPAKKGRAIERKRAAEKAKITRQFKQEISQIVIKARKEADEEREARRRARKVQDESDKIRMREDANFRKQFSPGSMAKQSVNAKLKDMKPEWPKTVEAIEESIKIAEGREGEEAFWERIAEYDDFLADLDDIFYKSGDHISPIAFNKILNAINNRPMTAQEARDSQDNYEEDTSLNFDPDERY